MNTATRSWQQPDTCSTDFAFWWTIAGEWVEAPNERRSGWSGMLRVRYQGRIVYVKRQHNHLCRTLGHPLGWPTASREHSYLLRLNALKLGTPTPLFHGTTRHRNGTDTVLVTEELRDFQPLSAQTDLAPARRTTLARKVGSVLGKLHRARLQHSCLYDKHIMVRWHEDAPELALVDLEKMRARFTARGAAQHDLEQLKRHQSIWSADDWNRLEISHEFALTNPSMHWRHDEHTRKRPLTL
jgi:hypothetical protein